MTANRGVSRVVLADFKAKKRDEGAIEIVGDDGAVYRIDPPELWPDDIATLSANNDSVGMVRALLGDQYDAFVTTGGGSANMVAAIIQDVHGVAAGESSASSDS